MQLLLQNRKSREHFGGLRGDKEDHVNIRKFTKGFEWLMAGFKQTYTDWSK